MPMMLYTIVMEVKFTDNGKGNIKHTIEELDHSSFILIAGSIVVEIAMKRRDRNDSSSRR